LEDLALRNKWNAMPCVTGHFESVTDLCWEAESGDYLLTVSADQTCRLWAPVPALEDDEDIWVEMARPQVHGYDLTAVTSVSTEEHRHLFVSGADEKEVRVFDAPLSTLRLLQAACGKEAQIEKEISRVERAYIPSLGLSQKASAADGAEVDTSDFDPTLEESQLRLPLERDLGAVSLWPEMRKLYGHNTELFCLTSTVSACSGPKFSSSPFANDVLVASSTKARDVDAAAIRLWDVENGKCVQVLSVSSLII
jgi:elongator complex protein 2